MGTLQKASGEKGLWRGGRLGGVAYERFWNIGRKRRGEAMTLRTHATKIGVRLVHSLSLENSAADHESHPLAGKQRFGLLSRTLCSGCCLGSNQADALCLG